MTDELRRLLQRKWQPEGKSNKDLLAQQLLGLGLQGELDAIKYIYDRLDGRPAQAIEHGGPGGQAIVIKFLKAPDGNGDA